MKKNILLLSIALCLAQSIDSKEERWNWKKGEEKKWDDLNDLQFPSNFLWGCADSAWQTEGAETVDGKLVENSWTEYERSVDAQGQKLHKKECVDRGCHRWTRYEEDVALLPQIGMNAYRFSVEWSKIEPEEGVFDERAMQHYVDMVDEMIAQGITPVITLFHHTYPLWFAHKDGFEKKSNLHCFTEYAMHVFKHLHNKVRYWIIFNEPVGYAMEGYFRGNYPPRKKSLRLAGKVARNQLRTHVETAKLFKAVDNTVQVGIAHIINPLDVYHSWNPMERAVVRYFNYIVNDLTIDYFKTGKFNWGYLVTDNQPDAPNSLDFIGVNYYTHTTIKQTSPFNMIPMPRPEEKIIEAVPGRWKVMYPEGLYRAIKKVSVLKKPIFITENGCSSENLQIRDEYTKKHLYVISKAIKKGYDVRGYFYWTLVDSFCWRRGYGPKYGIFKVDRETQERTMRVGYDYLLAVVRRFCVRPF